MKNFNCHFLSPRFSISLTNVTPLVTFYCLNAQAGLGKPSKKRSGHQDVTFLKVVGSDRSPRRGNVVSACIHYFPQIMRQWSRQASRQAVKRSSRQALKGNSVGVMPCRGLFKNHFKAFWYTQIIGTWISKSSYSHLLRSLSTKSGLIRSWEVQDTYFSTSV